MRPALPRLLSRLTLLACAGTMLPQAKAQEGMPLSLAPGILPLQLLEVEERYLAAESSGDWQRGMTELAAMARTAKDSGERDVWLEAEFAWIKLASHLNDEEELSDALQQLVTRARDWGMTRKESEIFSWWADLLEDQGHWLMAMRAHDGAAQAALGDGLTSRGVHALLEMSRLCRENSHPWRLQQVWARLIQLEEDSGALIDKTARAAWETERALAEPFLAQLVPLTSAAPAVDLQPAATVVKVSAPHAEVGRARFFLTNESTRTVQGTLKADPQTGAVKKWETGASGHWLTLGAAPAKSSPVPAQRELSLRPGERLSVYVEREQPAKQDSVSLSWSGPDGESRAAAEYVFAAGEPLSSITSAGSFILRPGWSVPLYHELNHRGPGVRVEDFQFQASLPCRLEIFDVDGGRHPSVDAGKLLAVDADGDGLFVSPGDRILSDLNADSAADLLIGDRSRSLEVYAWPLVPLAPGEIITLTAKLRRPGNPADWRTDAESRLSTVPSPAAVTSGEKR
jgi:hypothetical protein